MSVTVIPLLRPAVTDVVRMLKDTAYADSLFVFPDDSTLLWILLRDYYPQTASIPVHSEQEIERALEEIKFLVTRHGYRRVFFAADEKQMFLCDNTDLQDHITNELRVLGDSDLLYMDPARRGTYGHTDQTLTIDELNLRMQILEGPLWIPIRGAG